MSTYKCRNISTAPLYLSRPIQTRSIVINSSAAPRLDIHVPFARTDFAKHSFRFSAPTVWNSVSVTNIDSLPLFLAECCNCLAMSGYCHMSPVVYLYVVLNSEFIVTIRLKLGSRSLQTKVAQSLNFYDGKFDGKIRRESLNQGAQTMVWWFPTLRYLGNGAR